MGQWVSVAFEDIEMGDRIRFSDEGRWVPRRGRLVIKVDGDTLLVQYDDGPFPWRDGGEAYQKWVGDEPDVVIDCSEYPELTQYQLSLNLEGTADGWVAGDEPTDFEARLDEELAAFKEFLMRKNRKYGNSALEPVRVFSKADTVEQIKVRMDDKINRMLQGNSAEDEDVVLDFVGYWFLLKIAEKKGGDE